MFYNSISAANIQNCVIAYTKKYKKIIIFFNYLIMNGKEFKKLLKLNGLTQEEAAKVFSVSRATICIWSKSDQIPDKIVKTINDTFRVKDPAISPISAGEQNIVSVNNINSPIDNRQYSEMIELCKEQIETLQNCLKEKDNQITNLLKAITDLTALLSDKKQ